MLRLLCEIGMKMKVNDPFVAQLCVDEET